MEVNEHVMQAERRQQTTEDEESTNNDNIQKDTETCAEAGNLQKDMLHANLEPDVDDSDQTCPICMDQWTSSGDHRLCCLRCGHLFGHSCILKWLRGSYGSENQRCPQCNKRAAVRHIRFLYAKKLISKDSGELEQAKKDLDSARAEKGLIQMELSQCNIRLRIYEQQLTCMRTRIAELESRQSEINIHTNQNISNPSEPRKFYLERSVDICKDSGCRVLAYNPWYKILVVSQKATNTLFNGYGVRKINLENFDTRQFIFLHNQAIRDITFHSMQQALLLSVGFDKCVKLMDIQNNVIVHTYQTTYPLWSCCWSGDNPSYFLVGAQNGSVAQFDIRQINSPIDTLDGPGDRSPVASLATVPPHPGSGIDKGGFIACRLNTCYTYEAKNSSYLPKQVFLEGPFVSVCYDEKINHALISSRPNTTQPYARHTVCTMKKIHEEVITCNVVHTFHAGNSQHLLSRPCYVHAENDTLVAAHQEANNSISLWSIASGKQLQMLPVTDPVMDLCSFTFNDNLLLASLSSKKLKLYKCG